MSNVHYEKAIKEKSFGDHVNELGMEFKAFGVGVQAAAAEMWDSAKDTANALIEEPIETGKQMAYDATIGTAEEIVKTTIWGAKMALDIGDTREKFGEEIQAEQELINEMGTSTYLGQQAAMIFGGFALKRLGVKDTPNLKKDSGGDGGKGQATEGTVKGVVPPKTVISPEMEAKILEGQRKAPKNELIGGHSPSINNANDNFAVEVLSTNADGTKNVVFTKQFPDGNISKLKKSTLFPDSWSDDQILKSITDVGNTPAISTRLRDGATWHRATINGVEIDVIKVGDDVTSGYPTGTINASRPSGF